jgi:hypothetical protein
MMEHANTHRPLSTLAREEVWQIFYSDVRVGMIGKRTGAPRDQAP